MQIDVFGKIYIVKHSQGCFFKIIWYPKSDFQKKMAIGITAMEENEAKRLYDGLKAYFEGTPLPEYVSVKNMQKIAKVTEDSRIKPEYFDMKAEEIQKENLVAEGREINGQ